MSLTLVFSQGKPCCKNKTGKEKVSCRFNQANIEVKNDAVVTDKRTDTTGNAGVQYPRANTNSINQKKYGCCANAPWWKFWAKKKNCLG